MLGKEIIVLALHKMLSGGTIKLTQIRDNETGNMSWIVKNSNNINSDMFFDINSAMECYNNHIRLLNI